MLLFFLPLFPEGRNTLWKKRKDWKRFNHPGFNVSISVSVMDVIGGLECIWRCCLSRELNSPELHGFNCMQNSVVLYFRWELQQGCYDSIIPHLFPINAGNADGA